MRKEIKSDFFPIGNGKVTNQAEIKSALNLYVAAGILKTKIINGEPQWTESDKFRKATDEERLEWLDRVQEGKSLPF